MENHSLTNISPLDGRYSDTAAFLKNYFSEYALFHYRVFVEIEYLLAFSDLKIIPVVQNKLKTQLKKISETFNLKDAEKIKKIEVKIQHDVKAVEYFLQEEFKKKGLSGLCQFIHIGLTSDDINNLAYGLILKDFTDEIAIPRLSELVRQISQIAIKYRNVPILGRTHGQPAVPTTFGKEIRNFQERVQQKLTRLKLIKVEGKLNGAVGNYNALVFVYPKIDWMKFSTKFLKKLGLEPNLFTTQILPYDNWIKLFQQYLLINGVIIDLARDLWFYILLEELKLKKKEEEVGSSTMPQKVNPIDFENAEGNAEIANSYFGLYQQKLISSRLQRDLSDSTVRRTFGEALGHTVLAWQSLSKGLGKIEVDEKKAEKHLNEHWEILTEAVQTYLRSNNRPEAYEKVKTFVRGRKMAKEDYLSLLKRLGIDDQKLKNLTPQTYLGTANNYD